MSNEKEYISLKFSPFLVRCDEDYNCHVYVRGQKEEVTKELTDEQKNVLIEDLIYAVSECVKASVTPQPKIDEIIKRIKETRDKDKLCEYPYNRCIKIIREVLG